MAVSISSHPFALGVSIRQPEARRDDTLVGGVMRTRVLPLQALLAVSSRDISGFRFLQFANPFSKVVLSSP